jgi:hypothetical protein
MNNRTARGSDVLSGAAKPKFEANLEIDGRHPKRRLVEAAMLVAPGIYLPIYAVLTNGSNANFRKGFYREE